MRFEKRRQREDETIDKFLDDLEMLRRSSQPDESNRRMNLAVASKIIDGVKNDELRTMLATHYTTLSTNACDIRPECEKCNLCRIRNFSSKPSGLVVFKN